MLSPGTQIPTGAGPVTLVRWLGRGKSGDSWLADLAGRAVVYKQMHDEHCAYYQFGDNKVRLEVGAYHRLRAAGLALPELLAHDEARGFLLKTYCDGPVADTWAPDAQALERAVLQLGAMAAQLRRQGLNIDYFPANFVITDDGPRYIDYEVNPYDPRWSLAHWGLYYWANREGMRRHAQTRDWRHINVDAHSGQPIRAPFEAQVAAWRRLMDAADPADQADSVDSA